MSLTNVSGNWLWSNWDANSNGDEPETTILINGGSSSHTFDAASSIQQTGGDVAKVTGGHTGTVDYFGAINATGSNGLKFDQADGEYNFVGDVTLNGTEGIDILGGSGTFTFTDTDISSLDINGGSSTVNFGANSSIIQGQNQSAIAVSNGHTGALDVDGTINATNGDGLQFDNADGEYNFNGQVGLNGGDSGIDILGNSNGTFTFTDTDITDPTGTAFHVDGGSPNVNYTGGSITQNNPAQTLKISNVSNCTINIGANLDINNSGIDPAILICDNDRLTHTLSDTIPMSPFDSGFIAEGTIFCTIDYGAVKVQGGGDAVTIRNSESSKFTFESLTVDGSRNGINIDNSADDIDFDIAEITNVDHIGVWIQNAFANVTFKRLDIDGARVGVQIDSLAGKFAITGDGTANSGGLMENVGSAFIKARDVDEIEIRDLRLESEFVVDSFFDVFTEISIGGSKAASSTTNSLSKNRASQARVVLSINRFTNSAVNIGVGGAGTADIELTGNTISTTGDSGLTVLTGDSSTALVTLTNNDVSAAANDFVLVQDSSSTFRLAGFSGGDADAVATFIQDNNVGTPSVAVSGTIRADPATSVEQPDTAPLPAAFGLQQNYPNPFNPSTTIRFALPNASVIKLDIFNVRGERVRSLTAAKFQAGEHEIGWDARDDSGKSLPSGLYVARIQAGDFSGHRKMLLVK